MSQSGTLLPPRLGTSIPSIPSYPSSPSMSCQYIFIPVFNHFFSFLYICLVNLHKSTSPFLVSNPAYKLQHTFTLCCISL